MCIYLCIYVCIYKHIVYSLAHTRTYMKEVLYRFRIKYCFLNIFFLNNRSRVDNSLQRRMPLTVPYRS